jgi:hypothetical protein
MDGHSYGGESARECGITLAASLKTCNHPPAMNPEGASARRQARRTAAGGNKTLASNVRESCQFRFAGGGLWSAMAQFSSFANYMSIPFQLSLIAWLLVCGCSPRDTASSAVAPSHQTNSFVFSDGTTMTVRERSGAELQGIRMIRKSAEGLAESYDAERGRISEEPGGIVRVTLFDAQVDSGSRGRMTVRELSVGLMR